MDKAAGYKEPGFTPRVSLYSRLPVTADEVRTERRINHNVYQTRNVYVYQTRNQIRPQIEVRYEHSWLLTAGRKLVPNQASILFDYCIEQCIKY